MILNFDFMYKINFIWKRNDMKIYFYEKQIMKKRNYYLFHSLFT